MSKIDNIDVEALAKPLTLWPLMLPLCLLNTIGWPGAFRPASAAWSA